MSETTFTFRVDTGLKDAFATAAKKQDRTVAQLLRDFMRSYIADTEKEPSYDEWFHRKVEAGERAYREGRFISQEEATLRAERRTARILDRSDL